MVINNKLPIIAGKIPPSDPTGIPFGPENKNSKLIDLNPFLKIYPNINITILNTIITHMLIQIFSI